MIKKAAFVSSLIVAAIPALAAGIDWNSDPMAGGREALVEAGREATVQAPAARPADDGRVAGVSASGPVSTQGHLNYDVWLEVKGAEIVAVAQVCDLDIDDCRFPLFKFPGLTFDAAKKAAFVGGRQVARLNSQGKVLLEGYALKWSAAGPALEMRLEPADDAYGGWMDFDGSPAFVCFQISSGRVHVIEGDISCDTPRAPNDDYFRLCSGEFLTSLKDAGLADGRAAGDIFDRLDHAKEVAPAGSYILSKELSGCR